MEVYINDRTRKSRKIKKVEESRLAREERERKAKEYEEEYYRQIRSGERRLYTDEYYQKEAEKAKRSAEQKTAHPDTMEKTPATILLIAGMVGSLIFKQWYVIWVVLLWWYFSQNRV